jgi:hypothetical protein
MRLQAMLSQINHTKLLITTHSLNGMLSDSDFNMYTRSSSSAKENLIVDPYGNPAPPLHLDEVHVTNCAATYIYYKLKCSSYLGLLIVSI